MVKDTDTYLDILEEDITEWNDSGTSWVYELKAIKLEHELGKDVSGAVTKLYARRLFEKGQLGHLADPGVVGLLKKAETLVKDIGDERQRRLMTLVLLRTAVLVDPGRADDLIRAAGTLSEHELLHAITGLKPAAGARYLHMVKDRALRHVFFMSSLAKVWDKDQARELVERYVGSLESKDLAEIDKPNEISRVCRRALRADKEWGLAVMERLAARLGTMTGGHELVPVVCGEMARVDVKRALDATNRLYEGTETIDGYHVKVKDRALAHIIDRAADPELASQLSRDIRDHYQRDRARLSVVQALALDHPGRALTMTNEIGHPRLRAQALLKVGLGTGEEGRARKLWKEFIGCCEPDDKGLLHAIDRISCEIGIENTFKMANVVRPGIIMRLDALIEELAMIASITVKDRETVMNMIHSYTDRAKREDDPEKRALYLIGISEALLHVDKKKAKTVLEDAITSIMSMQEDGEDQGQNLRTGAALTGAFDIERALEIFHKIKDKNKETDRWFWQKLAEGDTDKALDAVEKTGDPATKFWLLLGTIKKMIRERSLEVLDGKEKLAVDRYESGVEDVLGSIS